MYVKMPLGFRSRWKTIFVTSFFWISLAIYIPAIMQIIRFASNQYPRPATDPDPTLHPTRQSPTCSTPVFLHSAGILEPRRRIGNGQKNATLVIGIPTVRRISYDYLEETLTSLLINLNKTEEKDIVIIIMIADLNQSAIDRTIQQVSEGFESYINEGLVEIIVPPPEFYPPLKNVSTSTDSVERVRWRTKQALDFSYLMLYSQSKAKYYIQLEDDVVTKPQYVSEIKAYINNHTNFIMMEFASLGFIGKLFKTSDLQTLAQFFLLFYELKPVDWLLYNYLFVAACEGSVETEICPKLQKSLVHQHVPPLFQHIGMQSSLVGKKQELQEKDFGDIPLYMPHYDNPPARNVSTTIDEYQPHTIQSMYNGTNFFWAVKPKENDTITIEFVEPIQLTGYLLKSGNGLHPNDTIYDGVVEVGKMNENAELHWELVGNFERGVAKATWSQPISISHFRIRVIKDSSFWVILRELCLKTKR